MWSNCTILILNRDFLMTVYITLHWWFFYWKFHIHSSNEHLCSSSSWLWLLHTRHVNNASHEHEQHKPNTETHSWLFAVTGMSEWTYWKILVGFKHHGLVIYAIECGHLHITYVHIKSLYFLSFIWNVIWL